MKIASDEFKAQGGNSMMNLAPQKLHEQLASALEPVIDGGQLPQVEIRCKNLHLTVDVLAINVDDNKNQLPTLINDLKHTLAALTATKRKVRKTILNNVTLTLRPGTMTLVLGQPGSGKSSLMRLLSGTFPTESSVQVEGDISYNGRLQQELAGRLPQLVAFVPQRDEHYPVLTVGETLMYAIRFNQPQLAMHNGRLLTSGGEQAIVNAKATLNELGERHPDIVTQQLGLDACKDTVLGDEMLRGVSGGEKKRVTLGEMSFGLRPAAFMDEISTGLDASATFDIVKSLRDQADRMGSTLVISLLQPSPEVFGLFDDVLLLSEGEVMYYGRADKVDAYFKGLGFDRPDARDVADFLLDLGTPQQVQYESVISTEGIGRSYPRVASEFAKHFHSSDNYEHDIRETAGSVQKSDFMEQFLDDLPMFGQPMWENIRTLAVRQFQIGMRNTPYIKSRSFLVTFMGLLYGFVFWQTDLADAQVVQGVIYQAELFLVLSLSSHIPINMALRDVFYKQRRANFFQTAAYVIATSLSQYPSAIIESVFYGAIVYWMCGLVADATAFFVFILLFALCNLAFCAWFIFITSVASNLNMIKPVALYSDLIMNLFTGFLITRSDIPSYLIWVYWIDPLTWCFRALAVNIYRSPALDVCVYKSVDYCSTYGMTMGEYSLSLYGIQSDKMWIWAGALYLIAIYVVFLVLAFFALEYKRFDSTGSGSRLTKTDKTASSDGATKQAIDYVALVSPKASTQENFTAVAIPITHEQPRVVPVSLAFQDLWYSVPKPNTSNGSSKNETIDLLKGISGYALPGTMTALMGSSGAGKTTLMDVIAGRKTGGTIKGKVMLNGHEASALAIQRSTGYCEQTDVHLDSATIREALKFSAFLRQDSSVSIDAKLAAVDECIEMLDMQLIADQIVRECSAEQLKRLTIGVEMSAHPSVLFLDEPTSGLDARTAKIIMDGVRRVADSGRTVLCTIHQPSSEVFGLFDSLLLLKRGGETVFFGDLGDSCQHLIEYFESIPGVARIPSDYNPATWMLECIGAGVDIDRKAEMAMGDIDFVDIFSKSRQCEVLLDMLDRDGVGRESATSSAINFDRKRASSSMTQLRVLTRRVFDLYWRTPSYNVTRFTVSLALALLFGILYVGSSYNTYQGVNAGMGLIYISTVFVGFVPFNAVLPVALDQRNAFYRERASQAYSTISYLVADSLVEIPYAFASCLLFTIIFFPMVGFQGFWTAVLYWINASLLALGQIYFGQFFAYAVPSVEIASLLGVLYIASACVVMGFNPPASAIPAGCKWIYYSIPHSYSLSVFAALVFTDCSQENRSSIGCQMLTNTPIAYDGFSVKNYVEQVFEMKHEDIVRKLGIQLAFVIFFMIIKLLAMRFINHQRR